MTDEGSVSCAVCGQEFDHYDYLMDHVQVVHRPAQVYSHFTDQSPYDD